MNTQQPRAYCYLLFTRYTHSDTNTHTSNWILLVSVTTSAAPAVNIYFTIPAGRSPVQHDSQPVLYRGWGVCVCVFNHTRSHWLPCLVFEKTAFFLTTLSPLNVCDRLSLLSHPVVRSANAQWKHNVAKVSQRRNRTSILEALVLWRKRKHNRAGKVGESQTEMAKLWNGEQSRDGEVQFCPL